jgi:hypothetical protein
MCQLNCWKNHECKQEVEEKEQYSSVPNSPLPTEISLNPPNIKESHASEKSQTIVRNNEEDSEEILDESPKNEANDEIPKPNEILKPLAQTKVTISSTIDNNDIMEALELTEKIDPIVSSDTLSPEAIEQIFNGNFPTNDQADMDICTSGQNSSNDGNDLDSEEEKANQKKRKQIGNIKKQRIGSYQSSGSEKKEAILIPAKRLKEVKKFLEKLDEDEKKTKSTSNNSNEETSSDIEEKIESKSSKRIVEPKSKTDQKKKERNDTEIPDIKDLYPDYEPLHPTLRFSNGQLQILEETIKKEMEKPPKTRWSESQIAILDYGTGKFVSDNARIFEGSIVRYFFKKIGYVFITIKNGIYYAYFNDQNQNKKKVAAFSANDLAKQVFELNRDPNKDYLAGASINGNKVVGFEFFKYLDKHPDLLTKEKCVN